jgi:hypothetical protein
MEEMTYSSLKLLGLYALVLSVMAFAASAAQAEEGAKWLILTSGGETKDAANLKASLDAQVENSHKTLLTRVLGTHVLFLCTGTTFVSIFLDSNARIVGGRIVYTGCRMLLNEELSEACEPHSVGSPVGTVETNEVKGLLGLVGVGAARIRVEPNEGTTFANVNLGAECPIGENIPIRGVLYLVDSALTTHAVNHLVKEDAVNTDMWVLSKTAEHKVTISGSDEIFLTGEHAGLKWSGDPA